MPELDHPTPSSIPSGDLSSYQTHPSRLDNHPYLGQGKRIDITHLKTELIIRIFEQFAGASYSEPTILGHVCSEWRELALNLPTLWANIHVRWPNPRKGELGRINEYLRRSGTAPLELFFYYCNGCKREFDYELCHEILKAFVSRVEFWKEINFYIPINLWKTLYVIVHHDQKPRMLEKASLSFSDLFRGPGYFTPLNIEPYIDAIWQVLHKSPKLRQVDWAKIGIPEHAPFQQLTHVNPPPLSLEGVLSFLAKVPLIQEISLSIKATRFTSNLGLGIFPRPLLLQDLRILSVSGDDKSDSDGSPVLLSTLSQLIMVQLSSDSPNCPDSSEGPIVNSRPLKLMIQSSPKGP
ncbi:hypothetical protein M413DRAFT_29232 [Hebeloma cylindrosporum]|uniref:F-box domain-containing protein n=1 Tax=Hebeloma cylindrosporum TaxID=76867 RepID=A0A0C2YEP0_HEBCY|nr:hypothetical protein M413DRAFT_29232 [Hebeloma cylindrosporum h7]